jgi:phosphoserine phosphatase
MKEDQMITPRYALTAIATSTEEHVFQPLDALLSSMNIAPVATRELPVPRSLSSCRRARIHHFDAVEGAAEGAVKDIGIFQAQLRGLSEESGLDIFWQSIESRQRPYKLAIFDMDSTLIRCEVIDELASEAGVGNAVAAITEQAMRGEIDFKESFRRRLGMLEGLSEEVLGEVVGRLPITEGLPELITTLRARGVRTAIVSGGFSFFARYLQETYGFDRIKANDLEIVDGKVTGRVAGDIVDGEAKRAWLKSLATEFDLTTDQIIAVGDGANDIPMLTEAGLGVAFKAKPIVRESVPFAINSSGLDSVLYLLGSASEYALD